MGNACESRSLWIYATLGLALTACTPEDLAPVAPSDGEGLPGRGSRGDASVNDGAAIDGGTEDDAGTSLPEGCIEARSPSNRASVSIAAGGTFTLDPFGPDRAYARWDPSCGAPSIVVGLAEDTCAVNRGHQIFFSFRRDDFDGVTIGLGVNSIDVDSPITFRYRMPRAEGTTIWGNCSGSAGDLTFEFGDTIDLVPGDRIAGSYQGTLTVCDNALPSEIVPNTTLNGSFDVILEQTFEEACGVTDE